MTIKSIISIFLGALCMPCFMYAGMQTFFTQFVMNLSDVRTTIPLLDIVATLHTGRWTAWLLGEFVFIISAVIQAYTVHRLLRVPCSKAVPRMIIISILNSIVLFVIHELLGYAYHLQELHTFGIMILWTVFSVITMFIVQVFIAFYVYTKFDANVSSKKLIKVLSLAILLSMIFLMIIQMIQN